MTVSYCRLKMGAPQVLRMLDPWHLPTQSPPAWDAAADVVRPPLLHRKFNKNGSITGGRRDLLLR